MINILKFIVLYLYKTIINNPWKLIFTAIAITSFTFADTFADTKKTLIVSDSLNLNHTYQYVYQEANGVGIMDIIKELTLLRVMGLDLKSVVIFQQFNQIFLKEGIKIVYLGIIEMLEFISTRPNIEQKYITAHFIRTE